MPKEEWGTKRVCPTTGKRFYDLGRTPIVSPYTGETVTLDTGRGRMMVADKADKDAKAAATEDDDDVVVLDDDDEEETADVELAGDEVLEDDDEAEEVSLDEIGDIADEDED